jgi:hypothetical protein
MKYLILMLSVFASLSFSSLTLAQYDRPQGVVIYTVTVTVTLLKANPQAGQPSGRTDVFGRDIPQGNNLVFGNYTLNGEVYSTSRDTNTDYRPGQTFTIEIEVINPEVRNPNGGSY